MVKDNRVRPHIASLPLFQKFTDLAAIFAGLALSRIFLLDSISEFTALVWLLLLVNYYIASSMLSYNHSWRMQPTFKEIYRCFKVWSASFLLTIFSIQVISNSTELTPLLTISYYLGGGTILGASRVLTRFTLNYARSSGRNTKTIAIVGTGTLARSLYQTFKHYTWMGVSFSGYFCDPDDSTECCDISSPNHRGSIEDLVTLCQRGQIDEVYITLPMKEEAQIKRTLHLLSDSSVPVYVVPDVFTFSLLHSRWRDINGIPVVGVYDSPLSGYGGLVKRIEDVLLSVCILIIIAIPMICISLAVKFTSPGPMIFKQRRYGYGGKEVEVWKFRTMTVCENGTDVTQATKNDKRITKLGKFLRRTSLDELPQFINVLQGHMSIVGPRPHAVAHNEQYRKDINGYMLRHLVKPGITGWAQINGWRGETDTLEKMQRRVDFDLDYIRNWSLNLDLKIIIKTIFKGFVDKQAY